VLYMQDPTRTCFHRNRTHRHLSPGLSRLLLFFGFSMPQDQDYAEILDCFPRNDDFHCVGITNEGKPCGQKMLRKRDLREASTIIDTMNSHQQWSSSYPFLKRLAYLTLCPQVHRKRRCSQVVPVSGRWTAKIMERAAAEDAEILKRSREPTQQTGVPVCSYLSFF